MKFYGHANFQKNQIQNAALEQTSSFPTAPAVGQICFVNSIVYICIQNSPTPAVWIPLTREITAYTHSQNSAASTWTIQHDLNTTSVNVQVYDGAGRSIFPDEIETTSADEVVVTFNTAQAGRAVVVSGHFDGNVKPTYAYTFFQNTASDTWTITHNLGYNPIVRVFIGTNEVQPTTISHPTVNTTIITFDTAQVGNVRLI